MRPLSYLQTGDFQGFLMQLLYILPAIVIAISFHEAAHAWMSNKMGDSTAKNLGRVTLDPTKHFDVMGLITFILLGFGWGKPVPTNPRNYHNYKKANVLVALAGVTMNLVIGIVTAIIICILIVTGVFSITGSNVGNMSIVSIIHTILFYIASINLVLCFFNLIPVPPLDGHHLVKGYIARMSPNFYMNYQRYGFILLIIVLYATPLGSYISTLVMWILQGIAGLFGLPFVI